MASKLSGPVWMDLSKPRAIAYALASAGGNLSESCDRVFERYELTGDVEGAERFARALLREPKISREMETFPERTRLLFARELFQNLPVLASLDEAREPVQTTIDELPALKR
jgi:hypothetical protein